jgi:hypothetical protein
VVAVQGLVFIYQCLIQLFITVEVVGVVEIFKELVQGREAQAAEGLGQAQQALMAHQAQLTLEAAVGADIMALLLQTVEQEAQA